MFHRGTRLYNILMSPTPTGESAGRSRRPDSLRKYVSLLVVLMDRFLEPLPARIIRFKRGTPFLLNPSKIEQAAIGRKQCGNIGHVLRAGCR